jgi:hypothetical protein
MALKLYVFDEDTSIKISSDEGKSGPVVIIETPTPRGDKFWLTEAEALVALDGLLQWRYRGTGQDLCATCGHPRAASVHNPVYLHYCKFKMRLRDMLERMP